jgi:hypothetical protein
MAAMNWRLPFYIGVRGYWRVNELRLVQLLSSVGGVTEHAGDLEALLKRRFGLGVRSRHQHAEDPEGEQLSVFSESVAHECLQVFKRSADVACEYSDAAAVVGDDL